VSGSMVDIEGNAVPNISLLFTPDATPGNYKTTTTDETGRFSVEQIASGGLRISTQARPHMDISGINLVPGDDRDLRLVMDRGPHKITGVVRLRGNPAAKATLYLTWTHSEGGLTSTSFREAETADDGIYHFTGLGQGEHQLSVTHLSTEQRVERTINVGSDSVEQDVNLN